jgi:transcriptional regulator with XRE-family HTH domain
MATFGDTFRAILRSRGLTQAAAAELLNTTQSVISYYSNLDRPPRRGTLLNMAERLGVTVSELTGDREIKEKVKRPVIRTDSVLSTPNRPYENAMKRLKNRWKKRPQDRDTIKHLIAALFPAESDHIIAWLEHQ